MPTRLLAGCVLLGLLAGCSGGGGSALAQGFIDQLNRNNEAKKLSTPATQSARGGNAGDIWEQEIQRILADQKSCSDASDRLLTTWYPAYAWLTSDVSKATFSDLADQTMTAGKGEAEAVTVSVQADLDCMKPLLERLRLTDVELARLLGFRIELVETEYLLTMADYTSARISRGQVLGRMKKLASELKIAVEADLQKATSDAGYRSAMNQLAADRNAIIQNIRSQQYQQATSYRPFYCTKVLGRTMSSEAWSCGR